MNYTRSIEKSFKESLFKGKVVILYGARQVGKTTLVKKVLNESNVQSAYFQCDIPSERAIFLEPEPRKIKAVLGDVQLVVLDEAQLIENIGTVLKTLVDTFPDIQVIATGSASFDLANKVREPLTGRAREFVLYPLSFEERWMALPVEQRSSIFPDMMRFGGFPGLVDKSEEEKTRELELLQQNTLYKDIFALESIKKPVVLSNLARYLAFTIGSVITSGNIAKELKTDPKTVERYLDLLEKMFVIKRVYALSSNQRKVITKGYKVYFLDLGIRNTIIQGYQTLDLRNDLGGLFENFFFIERLKFLHNQQKSPETFFWRTYTKQEVDFVEKVTGEVTAFECKFGEHQKSRGLYAFAAEFPGAETHVIDPGTMRQFLIR